MDIDVNIKTRILTLVIFAAGLGLSPSLAADIDAGKKLARKCSVCHGKQGIARDPEVPNLAGQSEFYLAKAISDFISGKREDRRMTLIVKNLSKEEIKDLAAFYASMKVEIVKP